MARRPKHPAHENHERWLVSYADFITLLFAFFVVMFASSQADRGKAQQVSQSVSKAFEEGRMAAAIAAILGGSPVDKGKGSNGMKGPGGAELQVKPAAEANMAELLPSLQFLSEELADEIKAGKMQLHMEPRGLVVSLREAAFFPSGEDTIATGGYQSIGKVAQAIKQLTNPVRLEGHTDSLPIRNSRFRSNWELSAARGIAMLELLSTEFAVPREKMAIAGYAETVPVDTNGTPEGRARNRRVDIVILNQNGLSIEPQPQPQPQPQPEKAQAKPSPMAKPAGH